MATSRSRSRWKNDSKKLTAVNNVAGVPLSKSITAISTEREVMVDYVVANWARLKRTGFYPLSPNFEHSAHLRDAVKAPMDLRHFQLLRFVPPVNTLSYTSTRSDENLDRSLFKNSLKQPLLSIDGNVLQALHNAWGNAFGADPAIPDIPSVAVMTDVLKSRVLAKCADTDYAFGEDMAEIRETLQFIRSPFRSLSRLASNFARDVHRKKLSSKVKHAKNVASAWAEYRFAFSPLVRSVDDALAASADYFHKKSEDRYIRITDSMEGFGASTKIGATTKNFPYSGYSGLSWDVRTEAIRTLRHQVTVGIKVFHSDSSSFSSLIGVRGRDIPTVLWQVFPLSFLFDRFYDVSSWLKASSNFLSSNVSFAGGWVGSRVTDRLSRRYTYLNATGGGSYPYVTPACTKPWITSTFSMSRGQWVPTLGEARPPALAGKLVSSLSSTADLAAVITNRMSRTVRSQ